MGRENIYTITLDDDPLVWKIIQASTQVTSLPFSSKNGLLKQMERLHPLACFLDVYLEESSSSLDLIPSIRDKWPYTPILVMTASSDPVVISEALGLGANDFIKKPLDPLEIRTRFHVRTNELKEKEKNNVIYFEDLTLDGSHRTLSSPNKSLPLPPLSAELLGILMQAKGMLVDRSFLHKKLWGYCHVSQNNLDKQISTLRKYLTDAESEVMIKIIRNKGLYLSIEKGI